MMLVHIGQPEIAELVHNAWLKTLEDGIHTYDVYSEEYSKEKVGTCEFGEAVVARIGRQPERLKAVEYRKGEKSGLEIQVTPTKPATKEIVGVDVFIHKHDIAPDDLGAALERASGDGLRIKMITNRGVKVWPGGFPETFCTDHWRCRFKADTEDGTVQHNQIVSLLSRVAGDGLDFIKTENLCRFDGEPAYSLGQGE